MRLRKGALLAPSSGLALKVGSWLKDFKIFYDFFSFQTLTGWLRMASRLLPLVRVKMVLKVLVKTFRYVWCSGSWIEWIWLDLI